MPIWIEPLEARELLSQTHLTISGSRFLINGAVTNRSSALEGMLPNARAVNATFDDRNPATAGQWAYPDTHQWDARRNVDEFDAAVPSYHAKGLLAVSLSFQGGQPTLVTAPDAQPWDSSAFLPDGTLRGRFANNMRRALSTLDANGMVAFVQLFYFGQDQRLTDEAAVIHATDQATDFLLGNNFTNVVVVVANEANHFYQHAILRPPRVTELMRRIRSRSGGRLLVATSLSGGALPDATLVNASDVVLLHGNGQTPAGITTMVKTMRSRTSKPIVFDEDGHDMLNFDAATAAGASWGYYEQGPNDYRNGYQSVPINWSINTFRKQNFFNHVYAYTRPITPVAGSALPPVLINNTAASNPARTHLVTSLMADDADLMAIDSLSD
jgi:hypothetical protein